MILWKTSLKDVRAVEDYLIHTFHFTEENSGSEKRDSLGIASVRLMILTPNFSIKSTPLLSIIHEVECICFINSTV